MIWIMRPDSLNVWAIIGLCFIADNSMNLIKNIMKVDFTKFPLFTGIDRQDMVIADIRKDIADGIYRNVPGLPAHVLAEKIYRNELVELADDEIHILDLYTSASVGQLADSWQDYKKNNLETGK